MDTLDTDRLHLRRMGDADVDHLIALNSDPEVMRYLLPDLAPTREGMLADVLPYYRSFHGTPFGYWAAIERASGAWLGWFLFRPPREDPASGVIELGYRLTRAAWGHGYATEGSLALVVRGFTEHGVQVVVADTIGGEHGLARRHGEGGAAVRAGLARYGVRRPRRRGAGRGRLRPHARRMAREDTARHDRSLGTRRFGRRLTAPVSG